MIGKQFFFIVFVLIFSPALVWADSLNASSESGKIPTENSSRKNDSSCHNIQYAYKKFRPETLENLPFPPGALVEVKKCLDGNANEKISSQEEMNRAKIDKEKAVEKLSFLISYIYHQQKNLAGSYKETDREYHDLAERNFPMPKVYDRAVSNYENALKGYGEYQAYLSALPRAVSDYEKKVGSSFKDFALRKEDGIITMMKAPAFAQFSNSLDGLKIKTDDSSAARETPGENTSESRTDKDQEESRQNFCMFVGALAGSTAAENIILATLANPLSAVLGASLGATLCSEKFYEKMTLWPRSFTAKLVDMGSYIKDGLEEIGNGLSNIGKKYLYASPSNTSEKIAEHFENAKSWMNRKLGWQ